MFNIKHWYTYDELRMELFNEESSLDMTAIVEALDHMEKHEHDEADFGIMGRFIFSRKRETQQ